ncbi:phospholipase A1 2-like [Anticarsia gemmatalis]|uniref:phospholipase A1 2-like n=1 Tax=Anticarsia gemmatalis TaxID=129554 RepID=UPI003F768548
MCATTTEEGKEVFALSLRQLLLAECVPREEGRGKGEDCNYPRVANSEVRTPPYPHDAVIRKLDDGLRYQYVQDGDGTPHLVDLWVKTSDLQAAARFNPDRQNVYHLFTRQNPTVSQPMVLGGNVVARNFNPSRRTIVLIHGWRNSVTSEVNAVLVPAFLAAEDVNVIVVDWSAGADILYYPAAVTNTTPSGQSVARFITWLNSVTGAQLGRYHFVGHSLGGHQAGIAGRNLGGRVAYITALDPAFPGWITNNNRFSANDGVYTEVIHTNAGALGFLANLGDVDFYPNGGINMPGCSTQECDHSRAYYYMAESVRSGGFTGTRCASYITAMAGNCHLWGTLRMGGIWPKTGSTGIFHLETNDAPPFSLG